MVAGYYPPSIKDMPLEAIGVENPQREELFRREEQLNRVGKTRIKGKMRGGTAHFQDYMRYRETAVRCLRWGRGPRVCLLLAPYVHS
jgi:hypothetical protein